MNKRKLNKAIKEAEAKAQTATPEYRLIPSSEQIHLTDEQWKKVRVVDATHDLKINITAPDIINGKAKHTSCPIALCGSREFARIWVSVESIHIAAWLNGEIVRVRFRSGTFPRAYDAALNALAINLDATFPQLGIKPKVYTLRKITPSQTLKVKAVRSRLYVHEIQIGKRTVTARPKKNKSPEMVIVGRGVMRF